MAGGAYQSRYGPHASKKRGDKIPDLESRSATGHLLSLCVLTGCGTASTQESTTNVKVPHLVGMKVSVSNMNTSVSVPNHSLTIHSHYEHHTCGTKPAPSIRDVIQPSEDLSTLFNCSGYVFLQPDRVNLWVLEGASFPIPVSQGIPHRWTMWSQVGFRR